VLGLILVAGVLVGLETNAALMAQIGPWLGAADRLVLALFVVELLVRCGAHGARPWRFFRDPWNLFDFAIVAFCLLPLGAEYSAVLRLARVLRVLRLITALPRLQILVTALLKSIPSMAYVGVLLVVLFYVYAVVGVSLFGKADPAHFGSLGAAALALFQVVTLEGWADIMRTQLAAGPGTILTIGYFISFILLGTMITLNLLIGVIVTGMEEARQEMEDEARRIRLAGTGLPSAADDVADLRKQVDALQQALEALHRRLR
jgi:voltage-gated sodium channel